MTDDKKKTIERVKVSVRLRPLNDEDRKFSGKESIIEDANPHTGTITIKNDSDRKSFTFDSLFDQASSQKEIFLRVGRPVVESVLSGYNSTILAYGQTGTGKTHTMIGSSGKQRGIIPRCIKHIFKYTQKDPKHFFNIKIGFMQLYMEVLQDLIRPTPNIPIQVREDAEEGVFMSGLNWISITSVQECMNYLSIGDKNRSIAFTNMNSQSSRSHAIFMIKLEKHLKNNTIEGSPKHNKLTDNTMTKSTLYLVDLAGSERVSKTKISGNRLDEAKNINLSLLALGNVIHALSDGKSKFIPFRDSKLTRILEQSFGGNSKTSMIVTVGPSPANYQESSSSLLFASRAMKIQNIPKVNVDVDYKALCLKLQGEIDKINDKKNINNIEYDKILEENSNLKEKLDKVNFDKEKYLSEKEKLEKLLGEGKQDIDISALLGEHEESEQLKSYFKKKIESKEEEFKKYSQRAEKYISDKDEKILQLEARIQELETINSSLENEFRSTQVEFNKEKAETERLLREVYSLREKEFTDKDDFSKEIMRIIGSSSSNGGSSILLANKMKSPIPSPKMINVEKVKENFPKMPIFNQDFGPHRCEKSDYFQAELMRFKEFTDTLENYLIDLVERYNEESLRHKETIIMYEKDKKLFKKSTAKLIKAYKKLENKRFNDNDMRASALTAR